MQPFPGGYQQPPFNWPGYGPGYWEAPPAVGPPPRRNTTLWVVLTVAAVVVVAAGTGAVLWGLNSGPGNNKPHQAQPTPTTAVTEPSTATALPTAPTRVPPSILPPPVVGGCQGRTFGPAPQTPAGWSTVVSPRGLAYDVPPDWGVEECTALVGWEKPCADGPFGFCPVRTMSGAAVLPDPGCKGHAHALAGVPGAKNQPDINQALGNESELVSDIYTSDSGQVPAVALGQVRHLTVSGAPAAQMVARVSDIGSDGCTAPSALHSMLATTVPGIEGTVLFVISLRQGYPGAPDPAVIDRMVSTLRRID
jgi:hypothetical protein